MTLHQPDSPTTEAARAEWYDHWQRGPTRTRWSTLPVQVGDAAPDVDLMDARTGAAVPLAATWAERPAALLFWRHFGCSCGRDRAARLAAGYDDLDAAGAKVVLVGQGEPERALVYAAANGIPAGVTLLCDPDERSYRAFGVLEGDSHQILYDAGEELLRCDDAAGRELARGRHEQGRPMVDNPWLLPAEFVVATDGTIAQAYRSQWCEDLPDPRVTIAAIRIATGDLVPAYATTG